jgi:hypothetical protein
VKSWLSGRPVWRLIHDCHNYLNLLQRIQTVGTLTSLEASGGGLTLGIDRNSGSTSRSFTYPELVWEFRSLLTRISAVEQQDNWKVFIGIDELDRLGSTEQARAFLAEIKAIFDVPRVYFVLSESEDVGAAFIRRGLPTRDVIDSSLEDVMVIEPRTLPESGVLLQTRVPGFTDPFVALVHALSGGIPRDLIRYTRKVTEIHRRTDQAGLAALARELLWEEAAQALSGFRVLLAHQEESARSAQTVVRASFTSFGAVVVLARSSPRPPERIGPSAPGALPRSARTRSAVVAHPGRPSSHAFAAVCRGRCGAAGPSRGE